jgi:endonuclease/exonuclease/phosphatase family metal-dependent hydrolase
MANARHPETTFPTALRPLAGRQPGFSERREAPPSDDESQAKAAIDYVLVRPAQFRTVEARTIGAEAVDGVWASDHYGVLVRLAGLSRD